MRSILDKEDRDLLSKGIILLVAVAIVVLSLAILAAVAIRVFELVRWL